MLQVDLAATLLSVSPLQASPEKLWNLCRHMVASVYILYFQLAGGASDGGKQVTESEWQVLLQTGLLSQEEKKKLAEYRGFKPFLMQVWALRALSDHLADDAQKGPNASLAPFQQQALALRGFCADSTHPQPNDHARTINPCLIIHPAEAAWRMPYERTRRMLRCALIDCCVAAPQS